MASMAVLWAMRKSQLDTRRVVSKAARLRKALTKVSEVLGERPVAGHPGDEGDDRALIPAHNLLEGGL